MKKIMFAALLLCCWGLPQPAGAYLPFTINAFLGGKTLDDSDWGRYDDQAEFGIMGDFKENTWPLSVAAQVFYSADGKSESHDRDYWDDDDAYSYYGKEAYTLELNLGVKKTFALPRAWNLYLSGGGSLIEGGVEVTRVDYVEDHHYYRDTDSEDDTALGYWAAAGCYKTFRGHFNVGLEIRYSDAEIELYHRDREAGGLHAGLVLGYSWPHSR